MSPLLSYDPNVPPVVVPIYSASAFIGAVVGERATGELVAGGNGLWLFGFTSANSSAIFEVWTIAAASSLGSSINPTSANASAFGDGRAAQAVFHWGAQVDAGPVNAWRIDVGAGDGVAAQLFPQSPVYIASGRVAVMQFSIDNTAQWVGFHWQEIPS